MSLSLTQKKAVINEVSQAIALANAGVLAEYRGMTVAQLTRLRQEARRAGVWIKVVKNNLARRAIADTGFACLREYFIGPIIFSVSEDPVAVAKVMTRFARDNEHLKITVGAMNGSLMDPRMLDDLSKLPGREELLAKLMGTMQAPIQQFVATLNEVPSRFVRTLSAVAESKEAGGPSS